MFFFRIIYFDQYLFYFLDNQYISFLTIFVKFPKNIFIKNIKMKTKLFQSSLYYLKKFKN
jgi:hypothetical protein